MSNTDIFQNQSSTIKSIADKLGMDVPVEAIQLPSKGKLYPPDHPFSGQETVEVRSMTAREEDMLTSNALRKGASAINRVVASCLINKSVDVNTLLRGDREAILIALRVIGYGSEYKVQLTCPECDQSFPHTFQLGRLAISPLSAKPVTDGMNRFTYTLPLSKAKVEFKLLTCGDETEIAVQEERKKKLGAQAGNEVTTQLLYTLISYNGEESRDKLAQIVGNLRAGDSRALRSYITKIEPQVLMAQEAECPHCHAESEVEVPFTADFFWPTYDDEN